MGLLERMQRENYERGIVPPALTQHSKHLICEECGVEIEPRLEGSVGRYEEGNPIPVYRHSDTEICEEKRYERPGEQGD